MIYILKLLNINNFFINPGILSCFVYKSIKKDYNKHLKTLRTFKNVFIAAFAS